MSAAEWAVSRRAALRWPLPLGPLPTLLAIALIAICLAAGNWQTRRAAEKQALGERLERLHREPPVEIGSEALQASQIEFRRVQVRGTWRPEFSVLLDNKLHRRVPGYHVLTPLRIDGTAMHVLVNRGWVAGAPERTQLPEVRTTEELVEITGEARVATGKSLELGSDSAQGKVWQNLTLDRFREWSKLELQPVIVFQTSAADDKLVRDWDRPDFGIDTHRGYALQWYSLAVLTLVFYLAVSLRGRRRSEA